jgi:hypothetical protein
MQTSEGVSDASDGVNRGGNTSTQLDKFQGRRRDALVGRIQKKKLKLRS